MSWTWTPSAVGTSDLMYIRSLIGDIDTNDQQYQDETITGMLSRQGGRPLQTAMQLAAGLVAFYARRVAISVDGLRLDLSARVEHYKAVVDQIRMLVSTDPTSRGLPLVSGVSKAAMRTVSANTDRPGDRALVGMMEMPGVMLPTSPDELVNNYGGYFVP